MSDFDYEAELEAILSEFGAGSGSSAEENEGKEYFPVSGERHSYDANTYTAEEAADDTDIKRTRRENGRGGELTDAEPTVRFRAKDFYTVGNDGAKEARRAQAGKYTPEESWNDVSGEQTKGPSHGKKPGKNRASSVDYSDSLPADTEDKATGRTEDYYGGAGGKKPAARRSRPEKYAEEAADEERQPGRNGRSAREKTSQKKDYTPEQPRGGAETGGKKHVLISMIAFICSFALLFLVATGIHFGSAGQTGTSAAKSNINSVSKLDNTVNNMKSDIMSGLATIRKVYTIPEGERVAPKPDPACYGVTSIDNLQPVLDTIEKARNYGLLDGQDVIFSENSEFYHDPGISADIQFYCDETIMVICWKELIENRICSCVEVKIADASQFRRKLCEDTYDSSVYLFASDLAKQTNAVVAMNSDYYAFRNLGITVYDRTLYRFNEFTYSGFTQAYNSIDTLLIDSNGDFNFFKTGQQSTREDMEQFIKDNDILFSIAFGPVLVENGEALVCEGYPCGEINDEYSRAGFAQYDKLHYLYMAVSHADAADSAHPRCTVNQFATYMQSKHVDKAYCFDGGQTGEAVFNGVPYNHIDYGNERTVSDIIYFATALPEEVRG